MVLQYAKGGSFNNYINNDIINWFWSEKIKSIKEIIKGLKKIHENKIVTGNIILSFDNYYSIESENHTDNRSTTHPQHRLFILNPFTKELSKCDDAYNTSVEVIDFTKKPNISPRLFNIILRFIYCGNIELKNLQGPEVLKLLIAVDELNIQQLISYIQEYLIEHQTEFLHQNQTEFHIVPNAEIKTNVAPSRKSNLKFKLDSTLIESNHIPLFASWIDRKDPSYKKNDIPYELKLLYRSSRDGFDAASFHRNCDNKGATIWIAKIQGTTQLIGGYNPLDWGGNCGWKNTTDSFLFNITDGKNISTAKLSYVNNNNARCAIYCQDAQGPHMGNLYCTGTNSWIVYKHSYVNLTYPKIDIPERFMVENYEVFQVIKK
ncbi:hypothetical protein GLOIN_2v574542 [Rhizophagus irregularis DAOM 181602=DAOM 197198]|nr:hypothetical protein GLOIN_2v574542 [Rhizophagus irregularis DAOM 181602=DAOM 197198]